MSIYINVRVHNFLTVGVESRRVVSRGRVLFLIQHVGDLMKFVHLRSEVSAILSFLSKKQSDFSVVTLLFLPRISHLARKTHNLPKRFQTGKRFPHKTPWKMTLMNFKVIYLQINFPLRLSFSLSLSLNWFGQRVAKRRDG